MQILTRARRKVFDAIPRFSLTEREAFFNLDTGLRRVIRRLQSPENKVGFLLQMGYFKAKGKFFQPSKFADKDIRFCRRLLGISDVLDMGDYSDTTSTEHRTKILFLMGWKRLDQEHHEVLRIKSNRQVAQQVLAEDILFSLFDWCWQHRLVIPAYKTFNDIVAESFQAFETAVNKKIESQITDEQERQLSTLLHSPGVVPYFSELKRIPQGENQKSLVSAARQLEGIALISRQTTLSRYKAGTSYATH